jgi:hypothetical protein
MALGDNYITVQQLKDRLGVGDVEDDTLFTGAVAAATDGINHICERDFQQAAAASARRYKPIAPDLVIVDDFFTTTGLVVKTDQGDVGTYDTTISSTAFELDPIDGIVNGQPGWPYTAIHLVDGSCWPRGRRHTIQVTAQWGWAAVPAAITEAAYVLAEDLAKLRDTPFGVGGFGEFGRIRARENPNVAMLINDYRRGTSRGMLLVG